ncbi:hypothetical protein BDV28DRAFT_157606 [Aspergillus coremiiformis]|uniref:Uncharacterized protein n=1 Tax=Aspergillus coremiiformis TaxID=138285 RepID=A0A5N6Z530_9EURO|nr:hypothetical protein BDV28DRAFT_157606 [Aspergillus coremiiformis]
MTKIHIAITTDSGIYKHWGIFLDSAKTILQVRGSDRRFRYEPEDRDARDLDGLDELIFLCDVDEEKTRRVRRVASMVPVRSEVHGWNCQDWVMEVLDRLEEEGFRYFYVRGKMEGLV